MLVLLDFCDVCLGMQSIHVNPDNPMLEKRFMEWEKQCGCEEE
jgi:hypothetical protein